MNLLGQILADLVAVAAILGIAWRAAGTLTAVRFEVRQLRVDVDEITRDKRDDHQRIDQRITDNTTRISRHEQWHLDQVHRSRRN